MVIIFGKNWLGISNHVIEPSCIIVSGVVTVQTYLSKYWSTKFECASWDIFKQIFVIQRLSTSVTNRIYNLQVYSRNKGNFLVEFLSRDEIYERRTFISNHTEK